MEDIVSCKKAMEQFESQQFEEAKLSLLKCFTKIRREIIRHRGGKEKLDVTCKMVTAKNLEAQIHLALGSPEEATTSYDQSKQLLMGINDRKAIYLRGQIAYLSSEIAKIQNNETEFKELLINSKDLFFTAESYSTAIKVLYSLVDSDYLDTEEILKQYEEISQINKKVKDKNTQRYNQAKVNQSLGSIYYSRDLKKAQSYFKKANDDYSKLNLNRARSQVLLQMATLEEKYDLNKAKEELQEALELVNNEESKNEFGNITCRLAIIALKAGDHDTALLNFDEGQKYLKETGNIITQAEYYLEFAKILLLEARKKEDLSVARSYATNAQTNYNTVDDKYGKTLANIIQGIIKLEEGLTQEGSNQVKLARIYSKNLKKAEYRSGIHSNLVQLIEVDFHDLNGETIYQQLKQSIPAENLYLAEILHLFAILKADADQIFLLNKVQKIITNLAKKQDKLQPMLKSINRRILNEQLL